MELISIKEEIPEPISIKEEIPEPISENDDVKNHTHFNTIDYENFSANELCCKDKLLSVVMDSRGKIIKEEPSEYLEENSYNNQFLRETGDPLKMETFNKGDNLLYTENVDQESQVECKNSTDQLNRDATNQTQNSIENYVNQSSIEESKKLFCCDHCPFKCKERQYLVRHVFVHNKVGPRVKCTKCDYTATSAEVLIRHMSNKHIPPEWTKWYCCEHCSVKTKTKANLQKHVLCKHTSSDEIKWLHCDYCSYKAKIKYALDKHVLRLHVRSGDFKCTTCNSGFSRREYLKAHILRYHTPEELIKWFDCSLCSSKFKSHSGMKKHVRMQHGSDTNLKLAE